ncbi:hypothetical protein L0F63_000226 [Massospora cicadina]|nr:hypothetical protein L0F63_000226 [Massospora cicadina]
MENEHYLQGTKTVPCQGYSKKQVARYLDFIGFGKEWPTPTYDHLAKIVLKHTEAIPYGNLSYVYYHHTDTPATYPTDPLDPYSTKGSNLNPQVIYHKFMDEKRDGSCFEHGVFLANIFGPLGFRHYGVGGKTVINFDGVSSSKAVMTEIRHYALIVLLGQDRFLVDVGFGKFGIFVPLLLPSKESLVGPQVPIPGGVKLQVVRQHPLGAIDPSLPFPPLYLELDIDTIHFAITHNTAIEYNQLILLRRRITHPIPGVLMLRDTRLNFYADDGSVQQAILNTEAKRRYAILNLFGVHLPEQDEEHLPRPLDVKLVSHL